MWIAIAVILLLVGRVVNVYMETVYYREATEQRAEAERLLAERIANPNVAEEIDPNVAEEIDPIVVRSVPYDEKMNWRKLFGFNYGARCVQVYGSDLVIVLSVWMLSSMMGWSLAFGVLLAVLMYTTWLTDVREWYIYNRFTYPAIVLFLVFAIWFGPYVWWLHVAGGVTMYVMLTGISFFMRGKMGDGDVKLLTALGFYFGFADIIPVLFSASLLGLVYGGVLYVTRNKKSTAYPFGPFIVMGVYVVWVSGYSLLYM